MGSNDIVVLSGLCEYTALTLTRFLLFLLALHPNSLNIINKRLKEPHKTFVAIWTNAGYYSALS